MKLRISHITLIFLILIAVTCFNTWAQSDIEEHRECARCGMDRKAYGYSRMLILYEDGAKTGLCSLHCAVTEMNAQSKRKVKSLLVADRESQQLIAADMATWVMGGKKRGVMTKRPKWAFETIKGAQAFIAAQGGTIVSWDEVLTAAMEDTGPASH